MLEKILFWLKQRRLWAGLVGFLTIVLPYFGLEFIYGSPDFIDLLSNAGIAIAKVIESIGVLITAILAVWSYINPKK